MRKAYRDFVAQNILFNLFKEWITEFGLVSFKLIPVLVENVCTCHLVVKNLTVAFTKSKARRGLPQS